MENDVAIQVLRRMRRGNVNPIQYEALTTAINLLEDQKKEALENLRRYGFTKCKRKNILYK